MAAKDDSLHSDAKSTYLSMHITGSKEEYSNLNMNKVQPKVNDLPVISYSKQNSRGMFQNDVLEANAALLNTTDSDHLKTSKTSQMSLKNDVKKDLAPLLSLNSSNTDETNDAKNTSTTKSTLSLHIAAYENGKIDVVKNHNVEIYVDDTKEKLIKSANNDTFEFNKWQDIDHHVATKMKFGTSQHLLDPNNFELSSFSNNNNFRIQNAVTESIDDYKMVIEVDPTYVEQIQVKAKSSLPLSFKDFPGAGTFFGGGPTKQVQTETSLDTAELMLRVAELWSNKPKLLKAGQNRTAEHTQKVNAQWRYVENKLRSENILIPSNLRKSFNKFKNNTFNKIREMQRTGAEAVELNVAEEYIKNMYKGDQAVVGIPTDDVGMDDKIDQSDSESDDDINESQEIEENVEVAEGEEKRGRGLRTKKPTKLFTFGSEPAPKRHKPNEVETPAYDDHLHETTWDSPGLQERTPNILEISPQFSTRRPSSYRPTLNLSSYQSRSRQTQQQSNFFNSEFEEDEDTRSVQSINDDDENGKSLKVQTSKKEKKAKKNTGLDKPVSKGQTPMSKKGQVLAEGVKMMTETFASSAKLLDQDTQLRIDEIKSRSQLQKAIMPDATELARITKQKLEAEVEEAAAKAAKIRYEAEVAKSRAEKEKEEAEIKKIERRRAEIELKKSEIELAILEKNQ